MVSEFVNSEVFASMTTSTSSGQQPEVLLEQLVKEANMSASMISAISNQTSNRNPSMADVTEEDEERVMVRRDFVDVKKDVLDRASKFFF